MHTRLAFAIVYPLLCIAESFIQKKKKKDRGEAVYRRRQQTTGEGQPEFEDNHMLLLQRGRPHRSELPSKEPGKRETLGAVSCAPKGECMAYL